MNKPVIVSFGGGTQTVAIACLVVQGKLPKPERFVMADTGREATATWKYLESHVQPMLKEIGMQVEVASHVLAKVDLYSHKGKLLIPAFVSKNKERNTGRNGGRLQQFCTREWKVEVVKRYLRSKDYGPKKPVRLWLGISTDEIHRAKPSPKKWIEHHYPLLLDVPMRREEAIAVVEKMGLPTPPKSACWMCPFKANPQWIELKKDWPEDWNKAVALDEEIRKTTLEDGEVFLHRNRIPLTEISLTEEDSDDSISCDEGGFCML